MEIRYGLILALALTGCASAPPPASVRLMTEQEVATFRIDCHRQASQIAQLEQQLTARKFHVVDGVVGNEQPTTISKRFYTLTKLKIWTLRTECARS
jgi:hypothetical protein